MEVGDVVEDFSALDATGSEVTLSGLLAGGRVVLFFYPAAMTYGCTKESCHFRDLAGEFADLGAQPVGISPDTPDKQARFDEKYGLGFPLLADPTRRIAELFGAKRGGLMKVRRSTFVIDTDRKLLSVIASDVSMNVHADRALDVLRAAVKN